MPATDSITSESSNPAQQQSSQLQLPKFLVYIFANSTLVRYGQLDADDQEMVLRCPVCHCLITNQTNLCTDHYYVKSCCLIDYLMTISI